MYKFWSNQKGKIKRVKVTLKRAEYVGKRMPHMNMDTMDVRYVHRHFHELRDPEHHPSHVMMLKGYGRMQAGYVCSVKGPVDPYRTSNM